jgi:hypothetical protein
MNNAIIAIRFGRCQDEHPASLHEPNTIPCWIKCDPNEYLLPYNPVHEFLLEGEAMDGHTVIDFQEDCD